MATLRKAVLATAMLSTGLISSTGLATAAPSHDVQSHQNGYTAQDGGLVNSNGFKPNVNPDACNNDVPVNVLGVQVPVQDVTGSAAVLSHANHGANPGINKGCSNSDAS